MVAFWITLGNLLCVGLGWALCEWRYQWIDEQIEREEAFAAAMLRAEASQRLRKSREAV